MPWKECHVMDERLRFVARLLECETMTALCEEFGISRKPATRSTSGTGRSGCKVSLIEPTTASPRESAADGG